jgi:hypothetical protein
MANRKGASRTERRSDHYYTVVQERARETKRPVRRPLDVLDHIPVTGLEIMRLPPGDIIV